MEAKVISNYGDPGLTENYHFDILSRFVIVMLESTSRILTNNKWPSMIAVVKRPEHLWISSIGKAAPTPTSQVRIDNLGNANIGPAGTFTTQAIPGINFPYKLGETIKIRKSLFRSNFETDPSFFSSCNSEIGVNGLYGSGHTTGISDSFFSNDSKAWENIRTKAISLNPIYKLYNFALFKTQYEAFVLSITTEKLRSSLISLFKGSLTNNVGYKTAYELNGGYAFYRNTYMFDYECVFEDINLGNKFRVGSSECIPLVVATPNSFPTPKTRAAGTISYNPSYSPISV